MEFASNSGHLLCEKCRQFFDSRNKLFKHLKACGVRNRNALISMFEVTAPRDNILLVAIGGRMRGRTLASVESYSFATKLWNDCNRMMEHRGSHTGISYSKCIYVFGGGGFASNLSSCEKYSFATGNWTSISSMSILRHAHSASKVHDEVYIIGGWVNGSVCIDSVEVYNITNDAWRSVAPLITPRRLHSSAYLNGHIYVFGGYSCNANHLTTNTTITHAPADTADNSMESLDEENSKASSVEWYTNAAEVYNIKLNQWSTITPLPQPGPCTAIAVHTDKPSEGCIFVFMHGKSVYLYNPLADTYEVLCPLPLKEWFCFDGCVIDNNVCHSDGKIYLTGGAVNGIWSKKCYSFDVYTYEWTELPSMRLPRRRCSFVSAEL